MSKHNSKEIVHHINHTTMHPGMKALVSAIAALGLGLIVAAVFAVPLGLGERETFLPYDWIGLTRSGLVKVGIFLLVVAVLVELVRRRRDITISLADIRLLLSKQSGATLAIVLRELKSRNGVAYKPYSYSGFEKIVQQMRAAIGDLPSYFTLDACRHGGMTELEEAALTEGQGRALSGHKTAQAYRGYAKETFDRALAATRKRHAHRVANIDRTSIQNEGQNDVQNEVLEPKTTNAK